MESLVGKTLNDRYQVRQFLGQGGMAQVYQAWDVRRAAWVALKLLQADLGNDPLFLRRFEREAGVLEKLQHPNVVRFYGLEQDDRLVFMVVDYIDGQSLQAEIHALQGAMMPLARVLEIMRPVCSALHYAHQNGLVHCDVKPANILVEKNGRILVSDFGIARLADSGTMTMAGMGTPAYMAPEQILGKEATPQTDIYALGVMLYEMLSGGERPYTGEQSTQAGTTAEKVHWEHLHLNPAPLRRFHRQVPPALEAVGLKCLQKDPAMRFTSANELIDAIEAACQPAPGAAPGAHQPEPGPADLNPLMPAPPPAQPAAASPYQTRVVSAAIPEPASQDNLEAGALPGPPVADPYGTRRVTSSAPLTPPAPAGDPYETYLVAPSGPVTPPPAARPADQPANPPVDQAAQPPAGAPPAKAQSLARSPILWVGIGGVALLGLAGVALVVILLAGVLFRPAKQVDTPAPVGSTQAPLIAEGTKLVVVTPTLDQAAATTTAWQGAQTEAAQARKTTASAQAAGFATERALATASAEAQIEATNSALSAFLSPLGISGTPKLRLKPTSGSLEHDGSDSYISNATADVNVKDFVTEVVFENPYSTTFLQWNYGFGFRVANNNRFRLVVFSTRKWELSYNNIDISKGSLKNLDTSDDGQNSIRLVVKDGQGWFYLNGELISELNLDSNKNAGKIYVGTGFIYRSERAGESTPYKDWTIWELP